MADDDDSWRAACEMEKVSAVKKRFHISGLEDYKA